MDANIVFTFKTDLFLCPKLTTGGENLSDAALEQRRERPDPDGMSGGPLTSPLP